MSKFTIVVDDNVSVAPLAEMLASNGYRLNVLLGGNAVELTETEERKEEIAARFAASERRRRQFLEAGMEP